MSFLSEHALSTQEFVFLPCPNSNGILIKTKLHVNLNVGMKSLP